MDGSKEVMEVYKKIDEMSDKLDEFAGAFHQEVVSGELDEEEKNLVHELLEDYKEYIDSKEEYRLENTVDSKKKMLEKLEETMDTFERLGDEIIKDSDFREEREVAKKHIQKMKTF